VEEELHSFVTLKLDGSEWSASGLGCFTSSTHWRRGCMCPRACNNALEKKKNFFSSART